MGQSRSLIKKVSGRLGRARVENEWGEGKLHNRLRGKTFGEAHASGPLPRASLNLYLAFPPPIGCIIYFGQQMLRVAFRGTITGF